MLIPRIKGGELPSPLPPWQGWRAYDATDPVIAAQRLAVEVAKNYQLRVGTLVITFTPGLPSAALVEIGPSDDYFIEVDPRFKLESKNLAAILGHELAHVFLHRNRLELEDPLSNEILTDITAALYGFGAVMADSFTVTETHQQVPQGTMVTRQERNLGYLTPDELGYVLARCTPDNVIGYLSSSAARSALRKGQRKALSEINTPPLQSASWPARLGYWVNKKRAAPRVEGRLPARRRYGFGQDKVSFRCPQCCQGLRLPLDRTLEATCPRCRLCLPCRT